MKTLAVSVIMPTYNDARFIKQAIDSVREQSIQSWELIVVNDGSTDGTEAVLATSAQADPRIRVVAHSVNQGLVASLNHGLALAQAPLIARLDSDDYWTDPSKLSQQVAFMLSHPDYGLIGTRGEAISETGLSLFPLAFPERDEDIRRELLIHNCFIHSSVVLRKALVEQFGGYRASEGYVEDYELWLNLGTVSKFTVLPIVAVHYRINSRGLTQTKTVPQFQAFINLTKRFRHQYPNFYRAYLKLQVQKWFIRLVGSYLFNQVKTLLLQKK